MDYFNAVAPYLIEDQPVLEAFHRPAAEAARCRLTETAENAHFWHVSQGVKASDELVQKALGGFQSRLFLEIIKLFVDFAPCERTNGKVWHLTPNPLALGSAILEPLPHLVNHFGSYLDGISRVDSTEEHLLKLFLRLTLLVGTHEFTHILAGAAVGPGRHLILHELLHGVGKRNIHGLHGKFLYEELYRLCQFLSIIGRGSRLEIALDPHQALALPEPQMTLEISDCVRYSELAPFDGLIWPHL
jgi:hypothetical protein